MKRRKTGQKENCKQIVNNKQTYLTKYVFYAIIYM